MGPEPPPPPPINDVKVPDLKPKPKEKPEKDFK
jgi:hypothetical protein